MRAAGVVVAVVAIAASFWIFAGSSRSTRVAAQERAPAVGASAAGERPAAALLAQAGDQEDAGQSDRVHIQLWTLVAAAGAGGISLLAFLVRAAMGRAKPPPPPEEGHH